MAIHCLIVDDNEAFLEAAGVLLQREGVTIAGFASTSAEGLQLTETLRPDVVLVDISLGEESGIDLARQLAADERCEGVAVILISTRAEEDVADLIVGSGAVGFLSKAELSATAIRRMVGGD